MILYFKSALIGLIGVFLGLGLILFLYLIQPPVSAESSQVKEIEILSGMGFNEIADKLKTENIIRSEQVFKIYSLLANKAHQFKPGRYILSTNITVPELVRALTNGPAEISATIIPGMTLQEIDEKLSANAIIKPGDLINFKIDSIKNDYPWLDEIKSLEGFLLPDTYYFFQASDSKIIVKKFLDNFESKALPFLKRDDNLFQTIILASLLEKEIPDYNEKQIAAGLLKKRLAVGMPLQVDATIVYIKCSGRFLNCPRLTEADYKINSPYNTYLYPGLPIGPISNPSLETIQATLFSKKSEYWYYLSDVKTKKTIFSKTLEEHNQNRAKYLLGK